MITGFEAGTKYLLETYMRVIMKIQTGVVLADQ